MFLPIFIAILMGLVSPTNINHNPNHGSTVYITGETNPNDPGDGENDGGTQTDPGNDGTGGEDGSIKPPKP